MAQNPDQPHHAPDDLPGGSGAGGAARDPSHKDDQPPSSEDPLIAAARMAAEARSDGQPPEPQLPPPDYFPGYVIIREIHRGGQGVVYQALHKGTKRKVAIKVMREGAIAGARERTRFEREVEILAQLDHPNIVAVHDSGTVEGNFFYVMDYISGATLDVWVSQSNLSLGQILELFARICDAVNAAHLKGVIHRDLKPANIRVDANGQPHVVDFGLAKVATGEISDDDRLMTMTGQFIGSLPWASPEQAQGIPGMIDVRTDVYSLGVMLYQMLTGRFPYQVVGAMRDVLDNILRSEPARPSTVRRQINDEVETIILKCLSKERDRRYQNAGDVARDILHYLRGEPIEAKRDSGWYVLRKTARRYRGVSAVVLLFLVTLVTFSVVISALYAQRTRALADLTAESQARNRVIATLESWLTSPDPALGEGKDITMREVADIAAAGLDEDLPDQPRVEAALRSVIGQTYFNLGEWAKAEPQLRRALALQDGLLGPDEPETIATRGRLGVVLRNQVSFEEAEPLLDQAAADAERVLGAGDVRTVKLQNDLAQLYKYQRTRNTEAIATLRKALAAAESRPAFDAGTLAIVQGNLAEVLAAEGSIDEAEPLLRACIASLIRAHGAQHPDVARARTRLALVYSATDRADLARAEYEGALAVFDATLDPIHPDALATRLRLATLLEASGETDRAIAMFEAIVRAGEATMEESHPVLAWYRHLSGRALLNADRPAEARPLLEEAVGSLRAAAHPRAPDAIATLIRCCEAQGDSARAEELRGLLGPAGG